MKKKLLTTALVAALVPALTLGAAACSSSSSASAVTIAGQTANSGANASASGTTGSANGSAASSTASTTAAVISNDALATSWDPEDTDATYDASGAYQVTLNGDSIAFTGTGATVKGSAITITEPGVYAISGTLSDGQIVVDTATGGDVRLVLNGVDIACSTSAPIYVKNADKAIITLADGTTNTVTDGASYQLENSTSNEPNAAVFSKDDLSVNGSGSLTVKANYKNGIGTTNDLKIAGGTITVDAANDAIQGKDSVAVKSGTVTVNATGNGIQATNDTEAEKGYIAIEGGTFSITAGGDALQAVTTLAVAGGDFIITAGGGSGSGESADASAKGLKATGGVFVTGGSINLDTADDAIHSNGTVKIAAGTINIKSGDDGIHADASIQIDGGEITIAQSYEGIESMTETINGGTIHITSSDDAINVAGGADGSSVNGRPGQNQFAANADNVLYINGGYVAMDSGGDGLDCNGSIYLTGGAAIVNGPTNNGNGAIDYNGEFEATGGYLAAAGSSGMAEVPGESSSLCSIMVNFDSVQQAGTLVHIEGADGKEIVTMAPTKQFQSIVVTSVAIEQGSTYKVYLGGSYSGGVITDTIHTGGDYSGGNEYVSLTIEGIVTTSGQTGGFGGPQGGGRKRPGSGTTGGVTPGA